MLPEQRRNGPARAVELGAFSLFLVKARVREPAPARGLWNKIAQHDARPLDPMRGEEQPGPVERRGVIAQRRLEEALAARFRHRYLGLAQEVARHLRGIIQARVFEVDEAELARRAAD